MLVVCPTIVELHCVDTGGSVDSDKNGTDSVFFHRWHNDRRVPQMRLFDTGLCPARPVDDWVTGDHQTFLDTLLRTDGQSRPWCSWQLFYQLIERSHSDLFGFPGQMGVHGGCLG